jgi:hypothetical protein
MDWKQGSKPREQGSKPIDGRILLSCVGRMNYWILNFIPKGSDYPIMWSVSQTSDMFFPSIFAMSYLKKMLFEIELC